MVNQCVKHLTLPTALYVSITSLSLWDNILSQKLFGLTITIVDLRQNTTDINNSIVIRGASDHKTQIVSRVMDRINGEKGRQILYNFAFQLLLTVKNLRRTSSKNPAHSKCTMSHDDTFQRNCICHKEISFPV